MLANTYKRISRLIVNSDLAYGEDQFPCGSLSTPSFQMQDSAIIGYSREFNKPTEMISWITEFVVIKSQRIMDSLIPSMYIEYFASKIKITRTPSILFLDYQLKIEKMYDSLL